MKVQNVGMINYQKQQSFMALPKGRAPNLGELIIEIGAVMDSGNKDKARKLLADYRAAQPNTNHELNILNIVGSFLEAHKLSQAYDLFEIPCLGSSSVKPWTL